MASGKACSTKLNSTIEKEPHLLIYFVLDVTQVKFGKGHLLEGLNTFAEEKYKENQLLNTLVIIDEAHRLAPREKSDEDIINSVKNKLLDAVRTTRKYGLGWMFISQTLSSLDRGIIDMLRIMFFGFGLAQGTEYVALRELAGGDKKLLSYINHLGIPKVLSV